MVNMLDNAEVRLFTNLYIGKGAIKEDIFKHSSAAQRQGERYKDIFTHIFLGVGGPLNLHSFSCPVGGKYTGS